MGKLVYVAGFVDETAWGILPVFVLSVSLGALVRASRLDGAVRRAFTSGARISVPLAMAVGAFSPFFSCTVIPQVAELLIDELEQRLSRAIKDMLEGLPPVQKAALCLTEYEGMTQ